MTTPAEKPLRTKTRTPKKHPRSTREANAEHLLLQSFALRLGQEAARQNNIRVEKYLPLEDPRGASLAHLEGVGEEPIRIRATVTLTVNPKTGAVIDFTPPTSAR